MEWPPATADHYGMSRSSVRRPLTAGLLLAAAAAPPLAVADTPYETVDVITDHGVEHGSTCFRSFDGVAGAVAFDTTTPIAGARSLKLHVAAYDRVGCVEEYPYRAGPRAKEVTFSVNVRIDRPTSGDAALQACAVVYFADAQDPSTTCRSLPATARGVSRVSVTQPADDRFVQRAIVELTTDGTPIDATLDDVAFQVIDVPGATGPGRGGDIGGGAGGSTSGGGRGGCVPADEPAPHGPPSPISLCNANRTPPVTPNFHPKQPLAWAKQRPFISLADYDAPSTGSLYGKFKRFVDRAVVDHDPDYGYSSADAVLVHSRDPAANGRYIDDAIARVDAKVAAAEAAIAAGHAPEIAGDDYLDVGEDIEELALTYDHGYDRLSPAQRTRWLAYGEQAVSNVWSPATATWGTRPAGAFAWSGWSINNPGNNYFFSFVQATQMWTLATQSQAWARFLQTEKFPLLVDYYPRLDGGGSREGTGYGTAQRRLWENARTWRTNTGEDLVPVRSHAAQSIDYWIHATVPTLDHYAPVGDLSRESMPHLYDYQENLVREAVMAAPGTAAARRGTWWIAHNSVPDLMQNAFNVHDALLTPKDTAQAPTALSYDAPGVGQVFARSSWATDATWLDVTAGPYDESHAHQEQGGFTFFRRRWLTVTGNVFSRSGLQGGGGGDGHDLGTGANNVIRFVRKDGTDVPQNEAVATHAVKTVSANHLQVHADLTGDYSDSAGAVTRWTRDFDYRGTGLHVVDRCTVASGVTPTFQLIVPVKPTISAANGTVVAGGLKIAAPGLSARTTELRKLATDFTGGWRIELTNPKACAFDVTLTAQ
jgi:hypothetical protein